MKRALLALSCVVASILAAAPAPAATFPHNASPPGQIHVVSVNAMQAKTIGVKRFQMMLELARSVLKRPPAFDGGSIEVGAAPDIIVLQEMRPANQEIFANLLRQRSNFNYQIVGSVDIRSLSPQLGNKAAVRTPEGLRVAVTGYSMFDDKERSTNAGFNAHMTKPIDPRALLDLIDRL